MSRNLPIVLQILRSTLSKGLTPNREVDIGYDRKRLCLPCLERRRAEDPAGSDRRNAFRLPSSGSFFVSRRFSLPRQFTRAACLMHRASLVNLDSFNVPPPGRHLPVIRRAWKESRLETARTGSHNPLSNHNEGEEKWKACEGLRNLGSWDGCPSSCLLPS